MKRCYKCSSEKPSSEFYVARASKDGLAAECKACSKERSRLWALANVERVRARAKQWQSENPEKVKATRLRNRDKNRERSRHANRKYNYGITEEQFRTMIQLQEGKCKICGGIPVETLRIDHCHNTGRVRGLLCGKCNSALGFFGDSVRILQSAIVYLGGAA